VTPFYEPAWGHAGMARASTALCRALAARGHQVTVATARLDADAPAEETRDGVGVRRLRGPMRLARELWPWSPELGALLASLPVDVAHLHGHRSGLAWTAARALARRGIPYVLQPHGTFPSHGQRRLLKWALDLLGAGRIVERADTLLAVSAAEARDLPRPAHVIPNGVEPCGGAPGVRKASRPRLLFVGTDRFRRKRAGVLPALLGALPDAELELVGPFGSGCAAAFGPAAGRVRVRGVLRGDVLAQAYAEAHVVVHPAVGEAFGLVAFEAALHGTPAVVAGGHGCGEWFARAGGCVVPADDSGALAAAVRARLDDPALGVQEAATVAGFARSELSWERAAAEVEALYRSMLARRR
jgi:glycosyltransferase involved in cell wall biosynthesis